MADAPLYVVVGLIGAGKTTLARSMGTFTSFDDTWHGDLQQAGSSPEEAVEVFAKAESVIDGWWTWTTRWWETTLDPTLTLLAQRRGVRLIYLKMTPQQAWEAYLDKKHLYHGVLADADAYRASIPLRIARMDERVSQWGT